MNLVSEKKRPASSIMKSNFKNSTKSHNLAVSFENEPSEKPLKRFRLESRKESSAGNYCALFQDGNFNQPSTRLPSTRLRITSANTYSFKPGSVMNNLQLNYLVRNLRITISKPKNDRPKTSSLDGPMRLIHSGNHLSSNNSVDQSKVDLNTSIDVKVNRVRIPAFDVTPSQGKRSEAKQPTIRTSTKGFQSHSLDDIQTTIVRNDEPNFGVNKDSDQIVFANHPNSQRSRRPASSIANPSNTKRANTEESSVDPTISRFNLATHLITIDNHAFTSTQEKPRLSPVPCSTVNNLLRSPVSKQSEIDKTSLDRKSVLTEQQKKYHSNIRPVPSCYDHLYTLFKKTLFDIRTDVIEKTAVDSLKTEIINRLPFLAKGVFQTSEYISFIIRIIEQIRVKIEHRKLNPLGSQSQLSVSIISKAAEEEDDNGPNLQQDDIFCLIARLPNLATVMIFLNLYTKLLIAQRLPNRAIKVATYLLNMSQITSNSFFKSEAYYSLGECEELLLQTERAMVYYAKALQAVWEFDDKPRECLIYDKIGLHLYKMNLIHLSQYFHERFLTGIAEPLKTNSRIRAREEMKAESKQFAEHFLLRKGNLMDRYRASESLLKFKTQPLSEFSIVVRAEDGEAEMLKFLKGICLKVRLTPKKRTTARFTGVNLFIAMKKAGYIDQDFKKRKQGDVSFTASGKEELNNERMYIQKCCKIEENVTDTQPLLLNHQKNFNAVMEYFKSEYSKGKGFKEFEVARIRALNNHEIVVKEDVILLIREIQTYLTSNVNFLEDSRVEASIPYKSLGQSSQENKINSLVKPYYIS